MNDEELVEVIAEGSAGDIWPLLSERERRFHRKAAEKALAALRSAGFQVFRPEDCDQATVASELKDGSGYCRFGYQPAGVYSLVPADSGGSG